LNILVIDTSGYNPEFGYFENDCIIAHKKLFAESNADSLIYDMVIAFRNLGRKMSDIDIIGLSNGPGSFTGLRIGSAAAKGIATASRCKLVEINSLDAIAEKYRLLTGYTGSAVSLIPMNTKTREFYTSGYEIHTDGISRSSEYSVSALSGIEPGEKVLLLNDKLTDFQVGIPFVNLFESESFPALYSLLKIKIRNNQFSDFEKSEPFYMKDFVPLKKKL